MMALSKVWKNVWSIGQAIFVSFTPFLPLRRRITIIIVFISLLVTALLFLMFQHTSYHSWHNPFFPTTYEQLLERELERTLIQMAQPMSRYQRMQNPNTYEISFVTIRQFDDMLQKNKTRDQAYTDRIFRPSQVSKVNQLLPDLNDPRSLRPAYRMASNRENVDVVIGVPTVQREKASYLMTTVKYLVNGLSDSEASNTLIVIMIAERDLKYVVRLAKNIEKKFTREVVSGLIEVISPPATYYPDFSKLTSTLNDSLERTVWRSKQNLDCVFLMSYAKNKGTYYLMLEDDVISKTNYMRDIKKVIHRMSIMQPNWVIIEVCPIGAIGKLFRFSQIIHFITYILQFYSNMPLDWLIESYLRDRACNIYNTLVSESLLSNFCD